MADDEDLGEATKEAIRGWIRQAIAKSGGKLTGAGLARHLGLDKGTVSRFLNGKHGVRLQHIPLIASYLGEPPPDIVSPGRMIVPVSGTMQGVTVVGRLHKDLWHPQGATFAPTGRTTVPAPVGDKYLHADMKAFELGASSDKRRVERGDLLICVPIATYRPKLSPRDMVVTKRSKADFDNYNLAEVESHGRGRPRLIPLCTGDDAADLGDAEYLVVSVYRDVDAL